MGSSGGGTGFFTPRKYIAAIKEMHGTVKKNVEYFTLVINRAANKFPKSMEDTTKANE